MLRFFSTLFFCIFSTVTFAQCPPVETENTDVSPLSIAVADLDFTVGQPDPKVLTLGVINNKSSHCFKNFTLEISYLNKDNKVIDVAIENYYNMIVPAYGSINFRAINVAARPAADYATQKVRLLHAEVYPVDLFAQSRRENSPQGIVNFLPWLLLVFLVGSYFYTQRAKKLFYQRSLNVSERQAVAVELNAAEIKRLADLLVVKEKNN